MKCHNEPAESTSTIHPASALSTRVIDSTNGPRSSWDAEVRIDAEVIKVHVSSLSNLFDRQAATKPIKKGNA